MSSLFETVDLASLPAPAVIEALDYATIKQDALAQFRDILPTYELLLESDPVVKLMEAWVYRELALRERVNYVAKSKLLAFAVAGDLDHLAAFYGVTRLVVAPATINPPADILMESDDAFRYRVQQRILALSSAGSVAHYRYYALGADPRVREVAVYSPDFSNVLHIGGGKVQIAILSTEGNLIPTPDLLINVAEIVGRQDVKMLTDLVEVIAAVPVHFNITAKVAFLPGTPISMVGVLQSRVQSEFLKIQGLGRDITTSWITGVLQAQGVHSVQVTQPMANLTIPQNYFPILDTVTILLSGYSDSDGYGAGESDEAQAQRVANSVYVNFAVANKRNQAGIMSDLQNAPTPGVIQPTVQGIAAFLNITNLSDPITGEYLPEDQIVYLIWLALSPRYLV